MPPDATLITSLKQSTSRFFAQGIRIIPVDALLQGTASCTRNRGFEREIYAHIDK
jgi:hypothetical protein